MNSRQPIDPNPCPSEIPSGELPAATALQAYTCRISGLTVRAEMELPGVVPVPVAAGQEDVRVRLRPVPEHLDEATTQGPVWELNARSFLLRLPGIGRFLASDGNTLDMAPEAGTDPADAMPFLLGTGFGALLLQRGEMVLHAAAVAVDGQAYVFCGPSGIGKSSLVAALCAAGCHFVSDDVSAIGVDGHGRPMIWPDGRRLKLFEQSIAHLGLAGRERGAVRSGIGKHYVEPPGPEAGAAVPLGAIYILRDQRLPNEPEFERLSVLDGAQTLLNQSYRLRLALAMAKRRQVAVTAAILRHAPVFHLTRQRDLGRLDATVAALRARWRGLAPDPAC
jgi:hypothetical protein